MSININSEGIVTLGGVAIIAAFGAWAIRECVKAEKEKEEATKKFTEKTAPIITEVEKSIDAASMDNENLSDPEDKVKARLILFEFKKPIVNAKTMSDFMAARSNFNIVRERFMRGDAGTWVSYYYILYTQKIEKEKLKAEQEFKERQISLNTKSMESLIKTVGAWILPEIRKLVRGC